MRKKGTVVQKYDTNGIDNSRCLLIENYDKDVWTYSHKDLIEVNIGDIFGFTGIIKKNLNIKQKKI